MPPSVPPLPDRPTARGAGWPQRFALGVLVALASCGGGDGGSAQADRVVFETPIELTAAQVLSGDPTDGRCASASEPCFKNNKDILGGQRTLARVDDMQVTFESELDGDATPYRHNVATLTTDNSKVTGAVVAEVAGYGVADGTPIRMTTVGARFGTVRQQLVRLRTAQKTSNAFTLSAYIGGASVSKDFDHPDGQPNPLWAQAADFDDSGNDRIVYAAGSSIGLISATTASSGAVTARFGDAASIGLAKALAVADFFGTGRVAVAAVADGSALKLEFFAVEAATDGIGLLSDRTQTVALPDGHTLLPDTVRLVAGRFSDPTYDQLALAFDELDGAGAPVGVSLVIVDRSSDGSVRQTYASQVLGVKSASRALSLDKGRLLASDPYEGLVVLQDRGDDDNRVMTLSLVDITDTLKPTLVSSTASGAPVCSFGMATGNFDRQRTLTGGTKAANLDLQIAFLQGADCKAGRSDDFYIGIVPISPGSNAANSPRAVVNANGDPDTDLQRIDTTGTVPVPNPITALSMTVLDTQGRSQLLGAPSVITVNDLNQPAVVIAAPPMHADWALAAGGALALTNLSMAPAGFNNSYNSASTNSATATNKSTSTWSFSAKESFEAKFTFGDCEVGDCASIANKTTAKQKLDGSTATFNSRMTTQQTSVTQQTDVDDVVWFRESTLTIYAYPVIGKTTCPSTKPVGCSDDERVPVTLLVAGPDSVRRVSAAGTLLPWYQPPWVTGQLLSYPGTVGQLRAAANLSASSIEPLSEPTTFYFDGTIAKESVSWSSVVKDGTTVKSNGNFSGENTSSVALKVGDEEISGEAKLSFSVGGSHGFRNLNDHQTTVSGASGMVVTKQVHVDDAAPFSYAFTPYIFGEKTPDAAVAVDDASDPYGAIRSGFVVDLNTDSGRPRDFWNRNYTAPGSGPDLALLHPQRRHVSNHSERPDQDGQSCLGVGETFQCVGEADATPSTPLQDERHLMRGFFISEAGIAAGQGPLKTTAIAGESVTLQARLHNLSLAPMPAGTHVRAAFHAMVWNDSTHQPTGSFAIGAPVDLGTPIPPYHTDDDSPNWTVVSQTFDTTGHENQTLYFWVVVWMEDGLDGPLIVEARDRGLTAKPTVTTSYAEAVALEGAHANNVGVFDMAFQVLPKTTVTATTPSPATRPSLRVSAVGREAPSVRRGESTIVAARVEVGEYDLPAGASVEFYDGDPAAGAAIIGIQKRSYLRANTTYDLRARLRSNRCGEHTVHVVTGPGTRFEHKVRLRPIEVVCS